MSLTVLFSVRTLALAQQAAAGDPGETAQHVEAAAQAAYDAGHARYRAGSFGEALTQFERAHLLSPRPAWLYDIGRAAESDDKTERAIEAYAAYLEQLPDADNRAYVEARLAKLRAAAAVPPPPPAPVAPLPRVMSAPPAGPRVTAPSPSAGAGRRAVAQERRPLYKNPWLWGGAAAVLAGAAVGVGVALARDEEPARPAFRGNSGISLTGL